jgi:hypothetical protein
MLESLANTMVLGVLLERLVIEHGGYDLVELLPGASPADARRLV